MQRTWWPEAGTIIVTGPYWGLIQMSASLQTAFSFSWKKAYDCQMKFHCCYVLIDNKPALIQIMVLARNRRQAIIWTNDVHWRIYASLSLGELTHWGRVTHICVSKITTISSDNGLSPGRRQAIICTNAGILLIQTLGSNFSEILREIFTFSFKKMHLKMSSGKCRPSCLGLNVLSNDGTQT